MSLSWLSSDRSCDILQLRSRVAATSCRIRSRASWCAVIRYVRCVDSFLAAPPCSASISSSASSGVLGRSSTAWRRASIASRSFSFFFGFVRSACSAIAAASAWRSSSSCSAVRYFWFHFSFARFSRLICS